MEEKVGDGKNETVERSEGDLYSSARRTDGTQQVQRDTSKLNKNGAFGPFSFFFYN